MELLAIIGATVLFIIIVGVLLWKAGYLKATITWDEE